MTDFHRVKKLFLTGFLGIFLTGCSHNPLDVDVSDIRCDMTIDRLDQEFRNASAENLAGLNQKWYKKYGEFYEIYLNLMLQVGPVDDSLTLKSIELMLKDPWIKMLNDDISKSFADLDWLETELEDAFKHVLYYYPNIKVPEIVTINSIFKNSVFFHDDLVAIGLERYLGPENRVVKRIPTDEKGIFQYEKDLMLKKFMVIDVMRGWVEKNLQPAEPDRDFLSHIVYQGKIMYALDAIFPNKEDHVKIRYSKSDLEWCEKSEASIWQFIVDKDLLKATSREKINDFIVEGPFTMGGLPQESPPRVGVWLGWKIVRAYMEEHPEMKLPDLFKEKNAWKILKSYNPPK